MQCYLALKRQYTVVTYLTTVTDVKHRDILTRYRLSAHSLAVETGRYKNEAAKTGATVPTVWRNCSRDRAALPHSGRKTSTCPGTILSKM